MANRWAALVTAVTLIIAASSAAQTSAGAQSVSLPPEMAPYAPANLRSYYVAFLVTPATPVEMPHDTWIAHQNYMRTQVEAGRYRLMGPIRGAEPIRGIVIIEASSIEEAQALIANDPAVLFGAFATEVHAAILPDLSALHVTYPNAQ